ncbi:MAG: Fe-S cluster assembly ATPase SufC [Candidatus Sungbacteria bacterium]|nr:Fe-S cluster assembly ATPase SufC [Candidatus Sungbacteria bacterium]
MEHSLIIKNLTVAVGNKEVVKDVNLEIRAGEIHALMGPNGSGKSSLAYAVAGHPEYKVTGGKILLGGTDLLLLPPEERARAGLFLSFQEPPEVGGVSMNIFFKTIAAEKQEAEITNQEALISRLGLQNSFLQRFLNEGFSGGEKKKSEILQFLARSPKFAIFDEIDSGLDVDSLQAVANIIKNAAAEGAGVLLISHAPRLFSRIVPHKIHVLMGGRVAVSGGPDIVASIERSGYGIYSSSSNLAEIASVA